MNPIVGDAVVSCYVAASSLLVMILLLSVTGRRIHRRNVSMRILYMLSLCVTVNCIFPLIYNAMYMQPAPWCHTAAVIAKTLREIVVLAIVVLWLLYVDHKLYGDRNWHSRKLRLVFLPFVLVLILLIVNLFTGIVFTFSPENRIERKPLLYVIFAVEFGYFILSAVMVRYFDRRSIKTRFLHIAPMVLSILLGSSTQLYTPYDIGILGYVIGITLLYYSVISEYRFVDEASGLYNRGYMVYLYDMALAGQYDARSALTVKVSGDLPAGYDILREILHKEYDVIRVEDKKFVMFSGTDSRSSLQLLSTRMEEAVAKHNTEHPENNVLMTASCRMRAAGEDAFTFLRSAFEEKDDGDPVRGVVSMLSELDRLDKELKLAGDIQLSMLPMNFPAFPDRTEFDLYASMTPAKEVGGDFYDFFLIDRDHLALVIADVSGKGIPAALFMTVSKNMIKGQLMSGCDPAAALERVNLQLCESNSSMMFVTVWAAVVEISTGKGMACNAGHECPCIRRAGGDFEMLNYRHGLLVGIKKQAKYENRPFEMKPGDCLFVYTDGVPESTDTGMEMFGDERLLDALNQDPDVSPEELIRRTHEAVNHFADGAPQFDDITMLCFKYYGPREQEKDM